mmetsp:Transcript_58625/g.67715  ORF Transcript_58625/g.67715 Transcript_58625/m.67715 type:complete len:208 (-) Transcript_58625:170-793(-)
MFKVQLPSIIYVLSSTMLFPHVPFTIIFLSILPDKNTLTMFLSMVILTFIASSITPSMFSIAMLLPILPISLILSSIRIRVDSIAFYLPIDEITCVDATITPGKSPFSMFFPVLKEPFVLVSIHSGLNTITVFLVVFPLSFIGDGGLVLCCRAQVADVVFTVAELAGSLSFVIFPKSLVFPAVRPSAGTVAFSLVFIPFSFVDSAVS